MVFNRWKYSSFSYFVLQPCFTLPLNRSTLPTYVNICLWRLNAHNSLNSCFNDIQKKLRDSLFILWKIGKVMAKQVNHLFIVKKKKKDIWWLNVCTYIYILTFSKVSCHSVVLRSNLLMCLNLSPYGWRDNVTAMKKIHLPEVLCSLVQFPAPPQARAD